MTKDLPEQAADAVRTALSRGPVQVVTLNVDGDFAETYQCPVCHQNGWLLCEQASQDVEWEHEGDGGVYQVEYLYPYLFSCAACRLELKADELGEASIPREIKLELDETGGWDEDH